MQYREITPADIPALFEVRVATDENRLTREELTRLGITEATVAARMANSFAGWLCEVDQKVVGFAMGDRATGELWVIAVLPEFCGRGIGSALLQLVESWLCAQGCTGLWLTTDVDQRLRAYSFYRKHGWEDDGIREGLRYMKKHPASPGRGRLP